MSGKEQIAHATTKRNVTTAITGQPSAFEAAGKMAKKTTPTKSHRVPNAGIPASLHPCMISEFPV
jgi:hypothetical protein